MTNKALKTYTRYAYYSLTDKKGRQSGEDSIESDGLYQPRYGLDYASADDFVLSQVLSIAYPSGRAFAPCLGGPGFDFRSNQTKYFKLLDI